MNSFVHVMSWNFLEGGCAHCDDPSKIQVDPARTKAAQLLIEQVQPDVLVLNEALWCEPFEGIHRDYAALFGFQHGQGLLYDKNWGNVILSRFPILRVQSFGIYNRAGLVLTLQTPTGCIQAGTYHPHPSRYPQHKAADFKAMIDLFQPNLPGFIAGDFNAISPADAPDVERLTRGFGLFSQRPKEDCLRFVDGGRALFPVLEAHGWCDAVTAPGQATIPTRLLPTNLDSMMRIDHIWHNPRFSRVSAGTLQDPLADAASDHYPVVATLTW